MFGGRSVKLVVCFVILSAFLICGLLPAYGDELSKFQEEQKKIYQQMEEQKRELIKKEKEKKTFASQLEELERDMEEVQNNLGDLDKQLRAAEKRVKIAETELEQTQSALDERTGVFKERIKEVYLNGQVSYIEVLFQATSISDFLVRFDFLEKLVEQDVEMLKTIEAEKKAIEEKKSRLEKDRNEIAKIKSRTEGQKQRLAQRQNEKKQMLVAVSREKAETERALDELERLSAQIAQKIKKIQQQRSKKSNQSFSGEFSWPTPGYTRITSDYGWRIHPILKTRRMHTGIDIGAPSGTSIQAVDAGTVIYTGMLGAYGNVVVIDHGGGISSMYAHQSRILVSENQDVKRGQVIGKVGSTGWSTGPHLHFEVRKNGDPINPWGYLK